MSILQCIPWRKNGRKQNVFLKRIYVTHHYTQNCLSQNGEVSILFGLIENIEHYFLSGDMWQKCFRLRIITKDNMKKQLQKLQKDFEKGLKNVSELLHLEELEQTYFGRKSGSFTLLSKEMKNISADMKKEMGKLVNDVRTSVKDAIEAKRGELQREAMGKIAEEEAIDVTEPQLPKKERGHLHPMTQIQNDIEDLFISMGFMIPDGPELDSDYYNFEAVNIPADHPARDMQDTFYIKDHPHWVMRTHTSTMQVRSLQKYGAPLRMIAPGRCFRNEATDTRHEHTFAQIEGMVVDKGISFSHLKGVLEVVAKHLYGPKTELRLRPKFYPFVEPGVNGEVTCFLCKGNGCRVCKKTGWLEIFGAGPTHPNVIAAGGVDPEEYQGFAFGFGLDRLVMLKYGIEDVRHFKSGDLRFLEQF